MDLFDWYYKQPVTPAEMTEAFEAADRSIRSLAVAMGLVGIALRGDVAERAPNTPTGVVLLGPLLAYDDGGNRIYVPDPTLDVDLSQDENSASTAVDTPGQERYLSIFVRFQRELSDARKDGNDEDVLFGRREGYRVVVAAGAPAPSGTASRPSLRAGHVLIADVRLGYNQSLVTAADVRTDRSEYLFRAASGNITLSGRTLKEVVQLLVDRMAALQAGMVGDAAGISFDPPAGMSSTNVQAALEELRTQISGMGGAPTAAQVSFTPTGSLSSNNVQTAIVEASNEALSAAAGAQSLAAQAQNTADLASNAISGVNAYARNLHNETDFLDKRYVWTNNQGHDFAAVRTPVLYLTQGEGLFGGGLVYDPQVLRTVTLPMSAGSPGLSDSQWYLADIGQGGLAWVTTKDNDVLRFTWHVPVLAKVVQVRVGAMQSNVAYNQRIRANFRRFRPNKNTPLGATAWDVNPDLADPLPLLSGGHHGYQIMDSGRYDQQGHDDYLIYDNAMEIVVRASDQASFGQDMVLWVEVSYLTSWLL